MEPQTNTRARVLPKKAEITKALGAFSPLERLAFMLAVFIGVIAVFSLLVGINAHFMVAVPSSGGTLDEGIVGTPRFVNPLLAASDADRDVTTLVYRGLMKKDANGDLVPDLATAYTVSPDGLTYTFTLSDAKFQDGVKVTSDDVLFTIKSAQDATLKSKERVSWEGVSAKAPDANTVVFTLHQPFAPFLENTTLGILPKHIWEKVPYDAWIYSDYNTTKAIGDGPFKVKSVSTSSSGIPQEYTLGAYRQKNGPSPLIDTVRLHFYANQDDLVAAYKSGSVDTLGGIDPANAEALAKSGASIEAAPLPRVFGLFLNQAQAKIFADANVRQAVNLAIDKDAIVRSVLGGYGTVATGPIPGSSPLASGSAAPTMRDVAKAKAVLEKDGWKLGQDGIYTKAVTKKSTMRLSFEIATNDTPELKQAVSMIADELAEAGIEATPKVYETGSLNQDIIRPRKFQALFFGEVVSNQSDLYAFWHSSQRTDPGLNISGYANSKVDKLLEQGLATLDPTKQATVYASVTKEINADMPAIFVYSPSYIYAVRPGLAGITLGTVSSPEERFNSITNWYLATDSVWKIFAHH